MRNLWILLPLILAGCHIFQSPCNRLLAALDDCDYSDDEGQCIGYSDDVLLCEAKAMEDDCNVNKAGRCGGGNNDTGWDTGYRRR